MIRKEITFSDRRLKECGAPAIPFLRLDCVSNHCRRKCSSFTESATGRSQWEPPVQGPTAPIDSVGPSASPPPTHANPKRRQYAAGQTQAYYGAADGTAGYDAGYGAGAPIQQQQPQPGGQLFTPGLVNDQFAGQQQQAPYYPPQEPGYGSDPAYGQQQAPMYGQPQGAPGQSQVGALADQFGQMGMGGQQKPFQLHTANLLTSPPDPRELSRPPPEIRLPPNACLSPNPAANAEPSILRCTLNAVPTTSSLLGKSKIPLGLVITPYRSLAEGESIVPVVTDTIIARCRRCRTYINPFVQFIDGGNRYVFPSRMWHLGLTKGS